MRKWIQKLLCLCFVLVNTGCGSRYGANIHTDTGSLVSVIGNILFLVGLGIVGAAWLMARRNENAAKETEKREE